MTRFSKLILALLCAAVIFSCGCLNLSDEEAITPEGTPGTVSVTDGPEAGTPGTDTQTMPPEIKTVPPAPTQTPGTVSGGSSSEPTWIPVSVTDQAGRRVTIEKKPERIVSGYYISSSLLIALDCDERLVGIESKADKRHIYALAAPALLKLPNTGSAKDFNLEQCIKLEPDLVILPKKLADAADIMEDLGISVILVDPESYDQLREMIKLVGKAVGETEKADDLLAYYDDKYGELADLLKDAEAPDVYLAGNSGVLSTAPAGMYQTSLIEKAGGRNVAAGIEGNYWVTVSYEQLIAWDPAYIVIVPEASYTADDIYAAGELASLSAVRKKNVYEMPSEFEPWDSPVPSGVIGTLWLANLLHGDRYGTERLTEDAAYFYKTFYGFEIEGITPAR